MSKETVLWSDYNGPVVYNGVTYYADVETQKPSCPPLILVDNFSDGRVRKNFVGRNLFTTDGRQIIWDPLEEDL